MRARIVDHYELHEELGHGGMATVYRATDLRLQREVALKILHDHIAAQPDNRDRFVREARAAARLEHPNIIHIYGFSDPDDTHGYLATELIRGPTLRALKEHALLEYPELSACLVYVIARALQHAHEAGIIHRDIKPENIMIDHDGRPRLMDFGLARLLDAHSMTATGSLMGSPAHMAPEIVEGKDYDERVDVFALGTVLYFLTTGRLPFEASNAATLLRMILEGTYPRAASLNESISAPLDGIIQRMLAHAPEDRFAGANEVADALASYWERSGVVDAEATFQRWWCERDAFIDAWRPDLIRAVAGEAQRAAKLGKDHIPEALDWTNRLLALDPTSAVGNDLLLQITTQSRATVILTKVAVMLVAMLSAATPILLVRACHPPSPTQLATPSFVHEHYNATLLEGAENHANNAARALATHLQSQIGAFDPAATSLADEPLDATRDAVHQTLDLASTRAAEARSQSPRRPTTRPTTPTARPSDTEAATPPVAPDDTAPRLRVYVTVQPPAAAVFVDGERRCSEGSRCTVELAPGTHSFVARHPVTGMEARETVNVQNDGAEVRMRIPWKPATLIVESARPGIVLFNGARVGRTGQTIEIPIEGLRSSANGTLRVIPDGDFGTPVERRVTLSSGEVRREPVSV